MHIANKLQTIPQIYWIIVRVIPVNRTGQYPAQCGRYVRVSEGSGPGEGRPG